MVVCVNLLTAHAVGDRQCAAGDKQSGQRPDQPLRIGEVRKSVVDDDAVKLSVKCRSLHISAEDCDGLLRELAPRDLGHFRGDIDAGDRSHVPFQIVRDQHPCPAGYV